MPDSVAAETLDSSPVDETTEDSASSAFPVREDVDDLLAVEESPDIKLPQLQAKKPLMELEAAEPLIGTKVLEVLNTQFKGSLTQVRYPDENDRLF